MAQVRAHDLLQEAIVGLSEDLAREVLDFVLFVQARRLEEAQLWAEVEAARQHRVEYPEEVQTVTGDEWDKLTAHFDNEGA